MNSRARYYHTARTAHLERLSSFAPGWFIYSHVRHDFDHELAASIPEVRQMSAARVGIFVIKQRITCLELPEALAVKLWPQLILLHLFIAFAKKLRLVDTEVVTYAIENYPTDDKLSDFLKLPRNISRIVTRFIGSLLLGTTDRIVFGTKEAEQIYERLMPRAMSRKTLRRSIVWALPAPAAHSGDVNPNSLVFLGTFEARKGIHRLMEAWPTVKGALPDAHLTILGKAGDLDHVRAFATADASVSLHEDPSREFIFETLNRSKALFLFSQPARGWKEQVGLPIVEGLAYGCEIVSSNETGIHQWLIDHGHQVLPWDSPAGAVADAITTALTSRRSKRDITASLPAVDGRLLADAELFVTVPDASV